MTSPDLVRPPAGLPDLDPSWSRVVRVPDADGALRRWHLLDTGAATARVGTLLCVHGNPTWSYLWRRLVAAPPDGWRVVAPDQLGMGYSERPDRPRTLAERVDDLRRLTAELRLDGPVVTVGHDWGGMVSLGWALAHRDQLRGVVLTNTAVHQPPESTGPLLIRLAYLPLVRETSCVRTPTFVRATTALSRPPLPAAVRDAFAAPYATPARRRSVGDFVADIPFAPDHPSRPTIDALAAGTATLDVPVLVLWGPRDPVFGRVHLADLLQRLPHAQLHRYERAGHLVTEDAPEYAGAVARWVAALDAPPAPPPPPAAANPPLWAALEARADDPTPAVVTVGGRSVSWTLLARRVREIAAGLRAVGVQPGDRVALLVPPSADLTAAVYAVWRAGAVIVVADKGLGVRGMGRALRGARPAHVIGTAQGLAAARAMRLPGRRISAGPMTRTTMRRLGAEHGLADLARLGAAPVVADLPEPSPDDECAVVFTSGATGPAKGVVYRHRQAAAQVALIRSTYGLSQQDRIVAAFAPFALLGPALGIGSAVPDIDVTAPGTLTATALANAAAAIDATVVFASPAALRNVLATGAAVDPDRRAALARIRLLLSAGAPVPASLLRSLRDVLPAADARTPYGMTEVLPVTDISLEQIEAAGVGEGICVGRPLSGVDVAVSPLSPLGVADGDLSTDADRLGEVCVRAAHVKDRYDALWATEQAASRTAGWHRTGDVGHLDAEGRLWIEGRLVHVVTAPGGVVTPVGLEQRVETLPGVRAAAVVGVGPVGTQQVVVVVVPEGGQPTSRSPLAELALADAVRGVATVPVAAVLTVPRLPVDIRHASKVDRQQLAGWAARVLAGARV